MQNHAKQMNADALGTTRQVKDKHVAGRPPQKPIHASVQIAGPPKVPTFLTDSLEFIYGFVTQVCILRHCLVLPIF